MFKPRYPRSLWTKLRNFIWPDMGWRRAFAYVGARLKRLPDTPHRISLGFACGVMASFTPFFGFHFMIGAILALITRSNVLASAIGTFVGNPVTFPFIAMIAYQTGVWLLGGDPDFDASMLSPSFVYHNPDRFFGELLLPYTVGGIAPGLLTSAVFYALIRPMVAQFQQLRRERLAARARERVHLGLRTTHHRVMPLVAHQHQKSQPTERSSDP